jgi:uncharacterized membrane protein
MNPHSRAKRLALTLGFSSAISIGLLMARISSTGSYRYNFLLWNLFLAWLPLLLVVLLERMQAARGITWRSFALGFLWFIFLPNSFYMVSDLVHIHTTAEVSVLYDAALLMSFAVNGLILGYTSLYIMHRHLLSRVSVRRAHLAVALVLLVSGFGVYLGRYLRWNTWDVLFNPSGLLFDVSDRFLSPSDYPQTFTTTFTFFVLLSGFYVVLWNLIGIIREEAVIVMRRKTTRGRWMDFKLPTRH